MEDKLLTLRESSDLLGVSTKTLQRWDGDGSLRVVRTPHGKRRVPLSEIRRLQGETVSADRVNVACLYARVSSHEQKARGDLSRQMEHLRSKLPDGGFDRVLEITDVASGLSDKRKGLLQMMHLAQRGEVTDIFVTYRDRLTRFGFGYLQQYFDAFGVRIHLTETVADRRSLQDELVEDLLAIVTSFSGKLYGLRSHRNARALVAAVKEAVCGEGDLRGEGP
ncbi:DNA binding domain protein, excisionase family [mine drainage metagenome]|uniref:DNA binding domain protein, excisionase family n=1 Tax=mine drainage metagenome TaxID=410659 RepID=T1BST8_9ZZZZ